MFKITSFAILVILLAVACQEDQLGTEKLQSNMVIKTGTICGWCSLNDTLTVSGNSLRYVNYIQCNNSMPAVEKNGQITTLEFEALLSKLDFNEFKKLNLNSCNVCFDGCIWFYHEFNGELIKKMRYNSINQ